MQIVDPTGSTPVTARVPLNPRPAALRRLRLAALDNGKPNAHHVLQLVGHGLSRRFGAQIPLPVSKPFSSRPAPDEVLDGFRGFDAALVGVGD